MHILFFSDNFFPETNAPASRTFEHCKHWADLGHDVTVITGAPNYPKGIVFPGYKNKVFKKEKVCGVTVIRVWTYITANEGTIRRTVDYLSYMITSFVASLFVKQVDIVVGTSPQFFTVCAAFLASRVKRVPWVFELRDLWPESIKTVGAINNDFLIKILEAIELYLYRQSNLIVTVTHSFKDVLVARGIDGAKVEVITNGANNKLFIHSHESGDLKCRLGLDGKFVLGYVGTLGMAHGLDTLLRAAKVFQEKPETKDFRVLLLGEGAEKKLLLEQAKQLNLQNTIFLDSVPKEEVVVYLSMLDVSIIHLKDYELFKTVIPSKLFECMALGLPVLHGVRGESAEIVRMTGVGVVFEPENVEQLCEAAIFMASNDAVRRRFSDAGPPAAKKYNRESLATRMLSNLEREVELLEKINR